MVINLKGVRNCRINCAEYSKFRFKMAIKSFHLISKANLKFGSGKVPENDLTKAQVRIPLMIFF